MMGANTFFLSLTYPEVSSLLPILAGTSTSLTNPFLIQGDVDGKTCGESYGRHTNIQQLFMIYVPVFSTRVPVFSTRAP